MPGVAGLAPRPPPPVPPVAIPAIGEACDGRPIGRRRGVPIMAGPLLFIAVMFEEAAPAAATVGSGAACPWPKGPGGVCVPV